MANVPALISGIKPPAMPVFEKFDATGILRVRRNWETDAVDWNIDVRNDRLIPRQSCQAIIAEIDAANMPAIKPIAARLTKLLLGAWPSRELNDPEIFTSILSLTFGAYPGDVGLAAVDALTRKSKWLPTRCDLIEALDEAMVPRQYAVHVVRQHLKRHDELDRERDHQREQLAARQRRYQAEPYLMVLHTFQRCFGIYREGDHWEAWLKAACEEFGVRTVEEWHEQASNAAAKPDNWVFLKLFLNKCATKARDEIEQPAAPAAEQQP
jgi:hypothetical protein